MENEENTKNNAGSIKITTVSPILHHAPNSYEKRNLSASRMYKNHSSRNGMRMRLAWWDNVDTWTYLKNKGKT